MTSLQSPSHEVTELLFDMWNRRKARIIELRFFGGLEVAEIADFLQISETTVMREWKMAKAWLHRELSDES
jgi:RNA polymerase sigma-70 factor, ECF subfamily